ncbi:MAG: Type 1 glutamine amidotransferase-like domain-containing protein [Bacteroidales bacterium]|nr:Type 1 glutamine amidotransferase-like domain-containing protein [Bacteroidales bacterium]
MVIYLTGSPTRKGEDHFTSDNGLLQEVLSDLPKDPVVLLVSADPDNDAYNASVYTSMCACFVRSGIKAKSYDMLKRSNCDKAEQLVLGADFVVLCGGHVPTQNKFFEEIGLRKIMESYDGVVMGCSAGAMNCADIVYSHPELPGESVDPSYRRILRGLGLTDISLVPHYEDVRHAILDGKRLFEDIIFQDSYQRKFYTFRDGGYVVIRDSRPELRGEAWEISRGGMHKICEENQKYTFMNAIFVSPHFPQTYSHFCRGLKANGVNVFGIADTPYENLSEELRSSLTEYYRVDDLEDYKQVYKAVAYFAYKYGKIDWIESNNEYWLEQDAALRTDFNVTTGIHSDRIKSIKEKSEMKKYYALGNIPTARQIKAAEGLDAVKKFASLTGYPIIAKPDNGVGAEGTFKMNSDAELEAFFAEHPSNYQLFVVEEFITGELTSYDAIFNSKGEPIFENNCIFPTPIMDIVHDDLDNCYYAEKKVPAKLSEIGRRTVNAFGIVSRFVHLEFFRLDRDREGLGKKGDYVGLEVNMRPAGGYTPDMMNFAHSTDVFQIWADMVAFDKRVKDEGEQFYCAYASRRDRHSYVHSEEEILQKYGEFIAMHDRMPKALSSALGDMVYMAKFSNKKQINEFFKFVTAKNK